MLQRQMRERLSPDELLDVVFDLDWSENEVIIFGQDNNQLINRIIDRAGLKGLRVGDAMVAHEHGNFIVNLGAATSAEVDELLAEIQARVGTPLELEWRRWGAQ